MNERSMFGATHTLQSARIHAVVNAGANVVANVVASIVASNFATAFRRIALALVLWLGVVSDVRAAGGGSEDEAPAFLAVPRVGVQSAARFRLLFESASTDVLRVAVLGDSQETSPGGFGSHYLPHLNARFAKVFGPAGESHLFTNVGMQSTPNWLATVGTSAARVETTVAPNAVLPGVVVHRLLADDGGPLGVQRTVFLHDASFVASEGLALGPWFDAGGPFAAEVLAIARPISTAVAWRNAPTMDDLPDNAAQTVQSGTLAVPQKARAGSWHWLSTPALDFAGKRHVQLCISGASAKNGTDIAGVRFRSLSAHRGVVVQSFARGGMKLVDVLGEHGASGAFLRALAPSVVVLHYGANDAASGISIETWRSQVLSTIAWLRTEMGDPNFPVILASDLRSGPVVTFPILDAMPGVAYDIAMSDPNILALNLPRIVAEEYHWIDRRPYLFDAAHYRPHGQRLLAEAFVGELCRALAIADPACTQPIWSDCVRSIGSTCGYGGCVLLTDIDAAVLGIPWNGAGTDCSDANGDGFPDLCPPPASPDINGDGVVDAGDLSILLSAWGTSAANADLDYDGMVGASDLAILLSRWGG